MPKKNLKQAEETTQTEVVENVTCDNFDVSRMYFTAREIDKQAAQILCFPKYLYDPKMKCTPDNFEKFGKSPLIVTEPIHMTRGGIPRYNSKYHGSDPNTNNRAFFYIPRNENDPNSVALFDMVQKIDDYLDQEINVKKNKNAIFSYLGKKKDRKTIKDITYKRMITSSKGPGTSIGEEEEEEDSNKKKYEPYDRIKCRFATFYDESLGPNDNRKITTQVYLDENVDHEDTSTVTDIEKHLVWNCKARFALMLNKVWIQKTGEKNCSVGIKCVQIGVSEKPEFRQNTSAQLTRSLFSNASTSSKKTKRAAKDDDEEEENESKEENEESEEENDEDNDEDNEKNVSEPESEEENEEDESEEESEDEKPVVKSKGKKAKVSAKKSKSASKGKKKSRR